MWADYWGTLGSVWCVLCARKLAFRVSLKITHCFIMEKFSVCLILVCIFSEFLIRVEGCTQRQASGSIIGWEVWWEQEGS